jgi:hypothetical protein
VEQFDRRLVFARRLRALIAAGVIALSSGATTTSLASEVDSQEEGVSTQPGGPDDEVGGGTAPETPLPVEIDPVLADPDQDVATEGPGDAEPPVAIPLEVVAPEGTGSGGGSGAESSPAPVEPPASPPPPAPAPDSDAGGDSGAVLLVEDQGGNQRTQHLHATKNDQERGHDDAVSRPPAVEVAAQPPPATEPAPSPEALPAETPAAGGRFHVVQPGESLWSIAADLLSPGASTAAVALRVHRLWELNEDRIGTGDPDVLPTGVKLRLR